VVSAAHGRLTLANLPQPPESTPTYQNAQVCDYVSAGSTHMRFRLRPPLTIRLQAQVIADGDRVGTAGFGLWNHPFSPDARRLPRLPRAAWFFFGAPPNDMRLAHGMPGSGFKAAVIDALTPRALALIPFALPAALLMRSPRAYDRLYPGIQRALKIAEAPLDTHLLNARCMYTIVWQADRVTFSVDDALVLETPFSPGGPMGFVAWIDNQFAIVHPQGRFGFGITPAAHAQRMELTIP
jgi:hypothetical protein